MENILIKFLHQEFRLEKINKETSKQLFVLFENNREDLHYFQLDMSLIENKNDFEKLIEKSLSFFTIHKNNSLIGCVYFKKWGIHDELSFWLDKDNRNNKIFTELLSLFLKSYVEYHNPNVLIWGARNKAVISKKLSKKLGFKTGFRFNGKVLQFDEKKAIPTSYFYKICKQDEHNFLDTFELKENILNDLQNFCNDLPDYAFKKNDFFISTENDYYYWSGLDVTEDLKEVYFINFAKSKSICKKLIKKISNNEEYLKLYNECKTLYVIYHIKLNTVSIMFWNSNKNINWIHFNNSIF